MPSTQNLIDNLVTHMITQEFRDQGTWGGNQTEAVYLVASLSPPDLQTFLDRFLAKMREQLVEELAGEALDAAGAKKATASFMKFNPKFGGGYRLPA